MQQSAYVIAADLEDVFSLCRYLGITQYTGYRVEAKCIGVGTTAVGHRVWGT